MIFEDGSGLSEGFQTFQTLDGYDFDEVISIPMSGYVKQPQYDLLGLNYRPENVVPDQDILYQHVQNTYGPHVTNQHALTAMPHEDTYDLFDGSDFSHTYEYPSSRISPATEIPQQSFVTTTNVQSVPLKPIHNAGQPSSRKRKASVDSVYDNFHVQKRPVTTQVHVHEPNGESYDFSAQTSPYSSLVPTPVAGPNVQGHAQNGSPRPMGHHYSRSNASQVSLAAPSPYTPAISPSFTTANTDQSPRAPTTPAPRPASTASPFGAANPKLIRTSTIPQQASPGLPPAGGPGNSIHAFNPYAMYPPNTKASLRLRGDLDAVAKDWSSEELDQRRKLIVFKRSQTGSIIDAEFNVVSPQEWSRADVTVNCIWWKEKNEAFVTSVDTIALLEQLVAVRFTVEEKNRIRRNLEGFRPLTVSKAKSDSEDFFKVIMGFPSPKPRNIEKDVKVFPWKILSTALKKIISKYSASYSSTASALSAGRVPAYGHIELPQQYHFSASPGPEYRQTIPQANAMSGYHPSMGPVRMSVPPTSTPEMQLHVPNGVPAYSGEPHYPYGPNTYAAPPAAAPAIVTYPQQVTTAPTGQIHPVWAFEGMSHHVPGSVGPAGHGSAPGTAYSHHLVETAGFPMSTIYHR